MKFHSVIVFGAERDQVHSTLTDFMLERGCQLAAPNAPACDDISFALWPEERRVCLQISDPLLCECPLFASPNDFFLPFSEEFPDSAVMAIDVDEDQRLQYWIFENGSCVDQFHSAWEDLPVADKESLKGDAALLVRLCGLEEAACRKWLDSGRNLDGLSDLLKLTTSEGAPTSALLTVLRFRLPEPAEHPHTPRRLFPWIVMAAPAVYFSLRYNSEPELKPAPHTPSDNPNLGKEHQFLLDHNFEFQGDYTIDIMPQTETFARMYYRHRDGLHAGISRFATPYDAEWQLELTTHFSDGVRLSTVRSNAPSPFAVPRRILFWEPETAALESLLCLHAKRTQDHSQNRSIQLSADFLDEVRSSIREDYQDLWSSGFLRRRKGAVYGLSWRGAFKMLYEHWKAGKRENA